VVLEMDDECILFEKIVQEGYVDTGLLIEASQNRREFLEALQYQRDVLPTAKAYLESFVTVCSLLKESRAKVRSQPLFMWNKQGSSSWLYERMNVERVIADTFVDAAKATDDLKQRRTHYADAIRYSLRAFNSLLATSWEDASMTFLPIFQDRFHMYHIAKNTAMYYKTMNDYSIAQNGNGNKICAKKAYEYMDVAVNIWLEDREASKVLHECKALHALNLVEDMSLDDCGEKTAILETFINVKDTPESVIAAHKLLKQQNENVYFQAEKTDKTISPSSLKELFHTLPVTIGDRATTT